MFAEGQQWRRGEASRREAYLDKGDAKLLSKGQQSLVHKSKHQGRSHVHDLTGWVVLDDVGNLHTTTQVERDDK